MVINVGVVIGKLENALRWKRKGRRSSPTSLVVALLLCYGVSVTDPSTTATRDDDHGGGDDVVLVEVAGDVEVAVDGVSVAEQPGLPRRRLVEALGEGEAVVAVPAPERRYVEPVVVLDMHTHTHTHT